MQKTILLIAISFLCLFNSLKAQNEIRNGIFLYGKLENSIHGNVLVAYKIDDPESEAIILDKMEKSNIALFSYHDFFFPGVHYEISEVDSLIKEKNIETIIYVTLKDLNSHTEINMTSFYSKLLDMSITNGRSNKVLDNLTLVFEIHSKSNNFKNPIAMLHVTGSNNWGHLGTFQGTLYRTMKTIMKTLNEEGAFGG